MSDCVAVAEVGTAAPRAASGVRDGIFTMLPMLVGFAPFALVIGSAVADHGSPLAGWAGSWLIFGGSAHLAAIRTLDKAGAVAAILTALLIQARLVVYSTSLARRWTGQPRWFRVTAAALIIDPTWAVADQHADECKDPREQRRFFAAAALTLGIGWSTAMAAGVLLGSRLEAVNLQIAVPLCLLALIGSGLGKGGTRSVIVVAAFTAFLTADWPSGTGLLAAVAAGCAAGMVSDQRAQERTTEERRTET